MKPLTVVSTFSGVGGSSLGYKLAGCNVLASLEFIPEARECYRLNFPHTPIIAKDIRDVKGTEILKLIGLKKGELDILDGSPPCASFSLAGLREDGWGKVKPYSSTKQRTDDLFDEQIRLISEILPKAIVLENVKGMTMGIAKDLLNNYLVKIRKLGYTLSVKIMNAQYFESPTSRERVFIIGVRNDLSVLPTHPKPFSQPITFKEATKGIINDRDEVNLLLLRLSRQNRLPYIMKHVKQGESAEKYHRKGSYYSHVRCHEDKPCPTITTMPNLYHPTQQRTLTIKELKAVSGFPNSFQIIGNYDQRYERIGRAVPPNLMKNIALHLGKLLNSAK